VRLGVKVANQDFGGLQEMEVETNVGTVDVGDGGCKSEVGLRTGYVIRR
jgi:hypothetical protein